MPQNATYRSKDTTPMPKVARAVAGRPIHALRKPIARVVLSVSVGALLFHLSGEQQKTHTAGPAALPVSCRVCTVLTETAPPTDFAAAPTPASTASRRTKTTTSFGLQPVPARPDGATLGQTEKDARPDPFTPISDAVPVSGFSAPTDAAGCPH